MTHTLILLRHGQSQFNNENLFAGWVDVPLTETGIEQAKNAANLLITANLQVDMIYTSKLQRTIQTSDIIVDQLNKQIQVKKDWRLNERHYGQLQGRKKSQVLKEVGKEKYMFWRRAYNGIPPLITLEESKKLIDFNNYSNDFNSIEEIPRGESLEMVVKRLQKLVYIDIKNDLINNNKTILIIGHGSTIRAILKLIKFISDEDIKQVNIPNCIPLVLNIDDDFNLIGNEVYLDPKEAKLKSELVRKEGFV